MKHSKLNSILESSEDKSLLANISSEKLIKPYLLQSLLGILSDDEPYAWNMQDERLLSLWRMTKEYFNSCLVAYMGGYTGPNGLEKLLKYSENIIYKVNADNGCRIATQKEVDNGVEGLIPTYTTSIEPDVKVHLNLLMWTFTGLMRYYLQAELECTYVNGTVQESIYQLIFRAGNKLRELVDWISIKGNYERALACLKIGKKNSNYKYPVFAEDEIQVTLTTKQVIFECSKILFQKDYVISNKDQFKAKNLINKIDKYKHKLLPHEISLLRQVLGDIKSGKTSQEVIDNIDPNLKLLCDKLVEGKNKGLLAESLLAFKIINFVLDTGRCSAKQLDILNQADMELTQIINTRKEEQDKAKKEAKQTKYSDESLKELADMSDALGMGVLGDT